MTKFSPKAHKDSYAEDKQEKDNAGYWCPDSGTFILVNTGLQFQYVGANQTKKCRVRAHILQVVEGDEQSAEALDDHTGRSFTFDLWWDLSKDANARRLGHLCAACQNIEEFDPDDKSSLVSAITGTPYKMKLRKKVETFNGKDREEPQIVAVQHIKGNLLKKFTSDPGWDKLVGAPDERFLEDRTFEPKSNGSGGRRRTEGPMPPMAPSQDSDPFADPT